MTPKTIPVLERCIDDGIRLGLARSRKHTDTPTDDAMAEHISRAVWENLYESFNFDKEQPQ